MSTCIIACSMLKKELEYAISISGADYPVFWLSRSLHSSPSNLGKELQKKIFQCEKEYDRILLGYCLCGNALEGITSKRAVIIIPCFHDCIDMWLWDGRKNISKRDNKTLYFTPEWTIDNEFLGNEYIRTEKQYGHDVAVKMYSDILKNYENISYIETANSNDIEVKQILRDLSYKLNLNFITCKGSCNPLVKLISGDIDKGFHILYPGEIIKVTEILDKIVTKL